MISTPELATRARNLGVPAEKVCRECLWPKTESGECVSAAERAFKAAQWHGPVADIWRSRVGMAMRLREGDALPFSPCSRERPRVQRMRLEALMTALSEAAPQWDVVSGYSAYRARRPGSGWILVDMVFEASAQCIRLQSGTIAKRASLESAFDRSLLPHELAGWSAVRDAHRQFYPPEVRPALDAVHAAWVAYKEVV